MPRHWLRSNQHLTTVPPASDLDVAELYRRHRALVARRVSQFVPRDEVEAVTHDVFLRALEAQHEFRHDSSPVTWLYRMATNHCLNWARDQRTRTRLLEQHAPTVWADRHKPDHDTTIFVRDLWRSLDPELAAIGVYFYLDGLTRADIALTMGYSERTIAYRLKELQRAVQAHESRR